MAGIMMIAIQTLEKEKELLRAKVETIEAENAELRSRLVKLEAVVNKLAETAPGADAHLVLK